jgi:hypothetical protein
MDFPQEIAAVYQKINTERSSWNRNDFYIEFEKPLEKGIALDKVYFRNQAAILEKRMIGFCHFFAPTNQDLILTAIP